MLCNRTSQPSDRYLQPTAHPTPPSSPSSRQTPTATALPCAVHALAQAGAEWLGVTDAAEGVAVRDALANAGMRAEDQPRILVMCGLESADAASIVEHRLTPVVWFAAQLAWLASFASAEAPLPVHVEVDTGYVAPGCAPRTGTRRSAPATGPYPLPPARWRHDPLRLGGDRRLRTHAGPGRQVRGSARAGADLRAPTSLAACRQHLHPR